MTKLITIAAVLAVSAGCSKNRRSTSQTYPALSEATETGSPSETNTEAGTIATPGTGTAVGMTSTGVDDDELPPGDDTLAEPSAGVLAGGRGPAVKPTAPHQVFLDPGATDPQAIDEAVAVLVPTQGNKVKGTVRFTETGAGVSMSADVTGLPKGTHAFHVHVFGDCSAPDAESAGDHFHFTGSSLSKDTRIITGNLGELTADKAGKATVTATIDRASLHGDYSILGRSVVVHALPNDPAKPPDGGAGKRLACGVIGVASVSAMEPTTPIAPKRPPQAP
jgi:superoxide dismutase, Cu-Zn family